MKISISFLLLLVVVIICLNYVDGRGGRGGSRFGGSRYSRSRYSRSSRSRSSSRSYSRSRVRSGNVRVGSRSINWKTAALGGYVYGWSSYSTRRYYYRNPSTAPTICENKYDYRMNNGTAYTLFICPKNGESSDKNYCCGTEGKEYCCAKPKNNSGRTAGIVIGVIVGVVILITAIYCCCKKKSGTERKVIETHNDQAGLPMNTYQKEPTFNQAEADAYMPAPEKQMDPSGQPYPIGLEAITPLAPYPTEPPPEYEPKPGQFDSPGVGPPPFPTAPYQATPYPTTPYPPTN